MNTALFVATWPIEDDTLHLGQAIALVEDDELVEVAWQAGCVLIEDPRWRITEAPVIPGQESPTGLYLLAEASAHPHSYDSPLDWRRDLRGRVA